MNDHPHHRNLLQIQSKTRTQLLADLRWLRGRLNGYSDSLVQGLIRQLQQELFGTLSPPLAQALRGHATRAKKGVPMDMSKYAGSAFLKPDDVRDAPIRGTIAAVEIGKKYDRPILIFSNGLKFTLNVTNAQEMLKVVGPESGDWLGEVVELTLGQVEYKDEMVDSILLKVIPREPGVEKKVPPKPKSATQSAARGDMDDAIPF